MRSSDPLLGNRGVETGNRKQGVEQVWRVRERERGKQRRRETGMGRGRGRRKKKDERFIPQLAPKKPG